MLVDSPEQRRLRIKDSRELAWQDWLGTAGFDREEDEWPRRWAEAYVDFAAGEKRAWLAGQGVQLHAQRRLGRARRLPRHRPRQLRAALPHHLGHRPRRGRAVRAPRARGGRARPRRAALPPQGRRARAHRRRGHAASAARCSSRAACAAARPARARAVGEFALEAPVVLVTSGGIGANHELVRRNWPERLGTPPTLDDLRRARPRRRAHDRDRPGRRRQRDQPRPHVALHRGHAQLGPDLDQPRDPDHPRALVAVVRRDRAAAAGAALPRLRHARDARAHHAARATTTPGSC